MKIKITNVEDKIRFMIAPYLPGSSRLCYDYIRYNYEIIKNLHRHNINTVERLINIL